MTRTNDIYTRIYMIGQCGMTSRVTSVRMLTEGAGDAAAEDLPCRTRAPREGREEVRGGKEERRERITIAALIFATPLL